METVLRSTAQSALHSRRLNCETARGRGRARSSKHAPDWSAHLKACPVYIYIYFFLLLLYLCQFWILFEAETIRVVAGSPPKSIFSYQNLIIVNTRSLSSNGSQSDQSQSRGFEFLGSLSAYQVLGVAESSSFDKIKASFRKLAKETHPDATNSIDDDSSHRFLQILAAYEILSDSKKRAHYDCHLVSQRKILQKHGKYDSVIFMYSSSLAISKQGEVVEWVRWYKHVVDDIVAERKVAVGSGYFYELESELYSAIRAAYYGLLIESMDFLPDCFEVEERSAYDTSEVLHLVSGRDLFGIVNIVNKVPELSDIHREKLNPFTSTDRNICRYDGHTNMGTGTTSSKSSAVLEMKDERGGLGIYRDLELHIYGQLVAKATRIPPKSYSSSKLEVDCEDQINVFLSLDEDKLYENQSVLLNSFSSSAGSSILLGRISGLGTQCEEGTCSVYDRNGTKTHVIMKHRTLMVKHMHWYQAGNEASACECRCSSARLPPSKFWLFEPRSSMQDIGGWYVETFGRDKKGRAIPSQRQWDSAREHPEKRLHPAMYLAALAYRTLHLEDSKRRKRTVRDFFNSRLYGALHWCRKLL